jgi:hypothetical protein
MEHVASLDPEAGRARGGAEPARHGQAETR